MGKRRKAREAALQILYQADVTREDRESQRTGSRSQSGPLGEEVDPFTAELVDGTLDHLEEIDGEIGRWSEHWSLDRMGIVDRNILRFATYELLFRSDIPSSVTINEAVEIAKKFGSEESSMFINGVLDRILRERRRDP